MKRSRVRADRQFHKSKSRSKAIPVAIAANYKVVMEEKKTPLIIEVNGGTLQCFYGEGNRADVEMQISRESFENIIMGRNTFQSSFMAGDMKMKGDFKVLRGLDQVLIFGSRTME